MPALAVPTLRTERLDLAPLSERDGPGMFKLWASARVCRHAGPAMDYEGAPIPLPARSRQDSDRLVDYWLRRRADGSGFRWAVRLRPDDLFVGAVGFNALGPLPELAYHLDPDHWGRGIMLEAAREALEWCFSSDEVVAVSAFIEPGNARSERLAKRLGFLPTGTPVGDTRRYELTASGWHARTA